MDVQTKPATVITGPIVGSRKIYSPAPGHPGIVVPLREVALHETANEPPFTLYDTSGPYTEPTERISLNAGLAKLRASWLAQRGLRRAGTGIPNRSLAGALCCRAVRFIPAIVAAFPATCQQRDNTVLRIRPHVGQQVDSTVALIQLPEFPEPPLTIPSLTPRGLTVA